jgi:adenylate cyclase
MPDLIAQGPETALRWRRNLPDDRAVVLGRTATGWSVAWDQGISRRHAELTWDGDHLRVQQVSEARNPIFFRGAEADTFELGPGEHFVIGQTTFTLVDQQINVSLEVPDPLREQTFHSRDLQRMRFRNADARIDVIMRLPEVISAAGDDDELLVRAVNMLLTGIPSSTGAAIVSCTPDPADGIEVLHWDRRNLDGGDFTPSQGLIRDAVGREESVLHVWARQGGDVSSNFTLQGNVDWAFCIPVGGPACRGWAVYVAGRFEQMPVAPVGISATPTDPTDLHDDLKIAELTASALRTAREGRRLERRNSTLSQFLSPVVLEALADEDPEHALAARECEVSVLFCDLRGFSRESEKSKDDLLGLLERVSNALGVTTRHILEQGGVVGDFHGDAVMGFWGWPLATETAVENACQAALAIRDEFDMAAKQEGHALAGFRMGIGIATGRAVAGKIGTADQVKVSVFGPVVNLASRLEGMTKILRAPILLDQQTAEVIRKSISPDVARCRRLANVRPYGLETSLEVTELLPPSSADATLADEHIRDYEAALDKVVAGEWDEAFNLLHSVPATDRAKDFLTVFIAQHNRTPPPNWDGVIPLTRKE